MALSHRPRHKFARPPTPNCLGSMMPGQPAAPTQELSPPLVNSQFQAADHSTSAPTRTLARYLSPGMPFGGIAADQGLTSDPRWLRTPTQMTAAFQTFSGANYEHPNLASRVFSRGNKKSVRICLLLLQRGRNFLFTQTRFIPNCTTYVLVRPSRVEVDPQTPIRVAPGCCQNTLSDIRQSPAEHTA